MPNQQADFLILDMLMKEFVDCHQVLENYISFFPFIKTVKMTKLLSNKSSITKLKSKILALAPNSGCTQRTL